MLTIRERNGRHQAIIRIKKGGVIVHQESKTFDSDRLARSWGTRREAELADHTPSQAKLKKKTLGQLLLEHHEKLSDVEGIGRTRLAELVQLAPYFMKDLLTDLTPHTFSKFAERRRAEGAGPATVLHNLSSIQSLLKGAKTVHGLPADATPVTEAMDHLKRIGTVGKSRSRTRRVSPEEVAKLTAEGLRMMGHPSTIIPMHKFVPLAVALPRRREELTSMLWENLNRAKRTITLVDTKHPTEPRTEVVPLSSEALEIIESLPVIDARILPYDPESVSAAFQRMTKRLGIDDLHLHDLRHEGISRLFEQGLDIPEVAMVSGHLNWQMLRRYTHLNVHRLAEKLNAGKQKAQKAPPEPP